MKGTNHTHPRSRGSTADLYHSAPLIVSYVLTVLKRTPQLPSNAYGLYNVAVGEWAVHVAATGGDNQTDNTLLEIAFLC